MRDSHQLRKQILEMVKTRRISSKDGLQLIKEIPSEHRESSPITGDSLDIAVIGVSGRFPGASGVREFWQNLMDGLCSIKKMDQLDRPGWNKLLEADVKGSSDNRYGAFVENIDGFDPLFFDISKKEAQMMDPRQRLFLQEAYLALENAGYADRDLEELECGVFVGCQEGDYTKNFSGELNPYIPTGNSNSIMAARISYFLNLRGPGVAVDTACSSALVAVHLACESIRNNTCQMAIAGSVLVLTTPLMFMGLSRLGLFSPTGECRVFDNQANGTVIGEAVGAVILKPLKAAIDNGDQVYGVIKGSEVNQDGKTSSITAPSALSQSALEAKVYEKFDIPPESIGYIEAHGTGTKLGDPIEMQALTDAFGKFTKEKHFCAIGSVKSNIGHSMCAAGISSLIKVLGCLQLGKIMPSPGFEKENEHIDFKHSPFYVNTRLKDWENKLDIPRRAAVSSFGFNGTNCHMVVEEAPLEYRRRRLPRDRPAYLLVFSAKSAASLSLRIKRFEEWVNNDGGQFPIGDISFTLAVGRSHFPFRMALVVDDLEDLKRKLSAIEFNKPTDCCFWGLPENGRRMPDQLVDNIESSTLETLGELFAQGYNLEWRTLYRGSGYRKISLPSYPFAQQSYWRQDIDGGGPVKSQSLSIAAEGLHPLVKRNTSSLKEIKFSSGFTGEEFFLRDHVVKGRKLLPGVAYLEMARAAGEMAGGRRVAGLRNVTWITPLAIDEDHGQVHLSLNRENRGIRCEAFTEDKGAGRQLHFQASLIADESSKPKGRVSTNAIDIESIKKRCRAVLDGAECYRLFQEAGYGYGSSFQSIRNLYIHDTEALSHLRLPHMEDSGKGEFVLHPSLFDGALQSIMGAVGSTREGAGVQFLPFSLGELLILKPLNEECYAYLKLIDNAGKSQSKVRKYDIYLTDTNGDVAVHMKDFTLRAFKSFHEPLDTELTDTLFCRFQWEETGDLAGALQQDLLIFDDSKEYLKEFRAIAAEQHKPAPRIVLVSRGDQFEKSDDLTYRINPSNQEHFHRLITDLIEDKRSLAHIIYRWPQEPENMYQGFHSLVYLTQALMKQRLKQTTRLLYMFGDNPLDAAVSGFARSVMVEHPKFIYKTLSLDKEDVDVNMLLGEFDENEDMDIRYRGGKRFARRLKEIETDGNGAEISRQLRPGGVYLITGGLGGLGLHLARSIATTEGVKLVLVDRSKLDKKRAAVIDELKGLGADAAYLQGDITQKGQVASIIKKTRKKFGKINGIIHAAGVNRDALCVNKTAESIETVLDPKVRGALFLDDATKDETLDFLVLFSSMAAVTGNRGQTDYAFANGFMDFYALKRREEGANVISINWPVWQDGGMKVDPASDKTVGQISGLRQLPTKDGIQAFSEALSLNESQVVVLHGDPGKIRTVFNVKKSPKGEDVASEDKGAGGQPFSENQLVELLSRDILSIASTFTTFEGNLELDRDIQEYGFDSVAITAFSNEINSNFGLDVTPAIFFELDDPTLDALVHYLCVEYREKLEQRYTPLDSSPQEQSADDITDLFMEDLVKMAGNFVSLDGQLERDRDIQEYGFDSVAITAFSNEINDVYRLDITPAVFFELDDPTLESLANYLLNEFNEPLANVYFQRTQTVTSELKKHHIHTESVEVPVGSSTDSTTQEPEIEAPVAIIGMSGIMPQSKDLEHFWHYLERGEDLITPAPADRWAGQSLPEGMAASIRGGFMRDIDMFDAEFFNISPREARAMDPQQRLFLETVWRTIEDAGYNAADLSGSKTALFIGISNSDYYEAMVKGGVHLDASAVIGHSTSIRANRVSFIFNFHGPSEPIDTACSSSLLAVHRGVEALRSGTCDQAIVGGSNAMISPTLFVTFQSAGMLSEDSRCRTFDKSANGYARGEGCGALFLKPLGRAEADGDHIYAVVKGTAENHGGHAKSLTSPNANAQAMVIVDAFERAGVDPDTVSYIEAHGTGTNLGDPVEINGLKKAFAQLYKNKDKAMPGTSHVGIGSVKTNIGHLEAAAGISGILKVLLSMKHKTLPATVHFKELNPYIDLSDTPFYIVDKTIPWSPLIDEHNKPVPRRAGISSFGYGGSNVHILLEEYQEAADDSGDSEAQLIVLSARNEERLKSYAQSMANFLNQYTGESPIVIPLCELVAELLNLEALDIDPRTNLSELGVDPVRMALLADLINDRFQKEISPEDMVEYPSVEALASYLSSNPPSLRQMAYTLQVGREEMDERLAVVADRVESLKEALLRFAKGDSADAGGFYRGTSAGVKNKKIEAVEESGDLDRIAKMWVTGHPIDWHVLHRGPKPRRVSLPTYPFQRERHWFDDLMKARGEEPPQQSATPPKLTLKSTGSPAAKINTSSPAVIRKTSVLTPTPKTLKPVPKEEEKPTRSDNGLLSSLKETLASILMMAPQKVDINKSFNDLGMDSVLGVEFTRKLKKEFQVDIKATRLYDYSTLSELAKYIGSLGGAEESVAPEPMKEAPPVSAVTNDSLGDEIKELLAAVLMMSPEKIDVKKPFSELGMDSVLGVEFTRKIKQKYHIEIKATRLYDHSSVQELVKYLDSLGGKSPQDPPRTSKTTVTEPLPVERELPVTEARCNASDIAIIGISGRYPGADSVSKLWENLVNGVDSVREVPPERWSIDTYYDHDPAKEGKTYCKWGGFLDDVDKFDPLFFNISPAEAELLDPQQRLFLQEAWRAFEDAGYSAEEIDNAKCGVYVGVMSDEYPDNMFNARSILAARISYFLNLKGPAVPIDTACSSSLVAMHLGGMSLINGEVDMALAGGVSLYLTVKPYIAMSKSGMLAKDGRCKTFDNSADGFVPGEGAGAVVLKLLENARTDGDHIYGVIKGSGINQDGRTNGITAPSARSQTELELEVYKRCGIDPQTISYIETHGTGTKLGDPIEIEGLTDAFREYTNKINVCPIGSIKTNLGHTSAAAGIASVIKVLLAMKHGKIPPSLHYRQENEHLDLSGSPFYVNTSLSPWRDIRRAAVSSFGYSGTNAHLIIDAPPKETDEAARLEKPCYLIPVSARSRSVMMTRLEDLLEWARLEGSSHWIGDIAFTLGKGRSHFDVRQALIVGSVDQLREDLEKLLAGETIDRSHPDEYTKKMFALASRYIKGETIDWDDVYPKGRYRRISLPTYPFEKRRCWISGFGNTKRGNLLAGTDCSTSLGKQCQLPLTGEEFFLKDNVVYDRKVLPGVAYLEMVRAAGEILGKRTVKKINHLVWSNLITVDNGPTVITIELKPDGDTAEFEVREERNDGPGVVNCRGKIEYGKLEPGGPKDVVDIKAIEKRCAGLLKGSECYEAYKTRKFVIGPSLQAVQELRYNDIEALAHLILHPSVPGELEDYQLHPALMDPILQTVTGLMINTVQEPGRPYLSFALGETEILRPLVRECYVYASVSANQVDGSPVKKFDMVMTDMNGLPLIRMRDFCLKKAYQPSGQIGHQPRMERSPDKALSLAPSHSEFRTAFVTEVAKVVAGILKVEEGEIDVVRPLLDYGFSSITMAEFIGRINKAYNIEFTIESFFDLRQPTIESLTEFLMERFGDSLAGHFGVSKEEEPQGFGFSAEEYECEEPETEHSPVAIIGMSGIFPQADNLAVFWKHISEGTSLVREFPEARKTPEFTGSGKGGYLDDIAGFDADFFGISAKKASLMDPQQRIALEQAWNAIEDAGYKASALAGSRTGVFFGFSPSGYGVLAGNTDRDQGSREVDPRLNTPSMMAHRISNFLDVHGPCETVDTAGSSSLIALHRGVEAIRRGDCRMAIAGGINLSLYPYRGDSMIGEGAGAVILKPLRAATRDGDHIYAVINGIAVQHSGRLTEHGYPPVESLESLFLDVYRHTGSDPASIGYIELNNSNGGWGQVEIDALNSAFEKSSKQSGVQLPAGQFCGIGALAQQTGHLEAAAGIGGVIKVALAMNHRQLPYSFDRNGTYDQKYLSKTPFYVVAETKPWKAGSDNETLLRSAVSALGIGGSKAHVVLESYLPEPKPENSQMDVPYIFVLSARNRRQLEVYAGEMLGFLQNPDASEVKKPKVPLNIRRVLKEIEDDILQLSTDLLKTGSEGYTSGSVEEFTGEVNRLLDLDITREYFAKAPSIGAFIQNLGRDFKEKIFLFYIERQRPAFCEGIDISQLAYTLQTGREEMDERLAIVASNVQELVESLADFAEGNPNDERLYHGNIADNSARFGFLLTGAEGGETVKNFVRKQNYENLANFWVLGGAVDWTLLYSGKTPGRMSLPTYPFCRKRYWLPSNDED